VKIRLEGTEAECEAAVRQIDQVLLVGRVSEPRLVGSRYRRNLWMSPWHENAAYLPP